MSRGIFLTLEDVHREDVRTVLELAGEISGSHFDRPLAGKTIFLAFFEPSTRTAASFELAAKNAGANVISISSQGSSLEKGESLMDTVVTLDRLGADALVVRHQAAGAAALAQKFTQAAVINAGDGCGQHPTQALLDLYALSGALGGFDELAGRRVAVVGDILHSRVARSVIPGFRAAGMEVSLVAPHTLLPQASGAWGAPVLDSVDEALEWGAEVLYVLRLQRERMAGARIPSAAEYGNRYRVNKRHLRPGVWVMHPGPVNRGVEIDGDIVMSGASLIPGQVAVGIPVRTAVLMLATGIEAGVTA